jgi:hypothetical protein
MFNIPSMRQLVEAVTPILPEHREQIDKPTAPINIGWQISKDATNKADHDGLSLRDGIPIIANPDNPSTIQYDNQGQENDKIAGLGTNPRTLSSFASRCILARRSWLRGLSPSGSQPQMTYERSK